MAKFSKSDMFNELKTIFLFEADHILMAAGEERACQFIGFALTDAGSYCFDNPQKVDLGLFRRIADCLGRGYDFAFAPSLLNSFSEHEVQDLIVFMQAVPRAGGAGGDGGETHRFMTPDGYCQTVADAVFARWKLERDGDHNTFTTRELALLANMTEGAVRTAIADKSGDGLKAIPGSKPVSVEFAEARRWLGGRRGFIPSPNRGSDDRFLERAIRDATTRERFAQLIAMGAGYPTPEEVAKRCEWPLSKSQEWLSADFTFSPSDALTFAERFGFDPPLFAGKALEISLRHEGR